MPGCTLPCYKYRSREKQYQQQQRRSSAEHVSKNADYILQECVFVLSREWLVEKSGYRGEIQHLEIQNTEHSVLVLGWLKKVDPGVRRGIRLLHSACTILDSSLHQTKIQIRQKYKYKYNRDEIRNTSIQNSKIKVYVYYYLILFATKINIVLEIQNASSSS